MIAADDRVSRVIVRARVLRLSDAAVASLDACVRGAAPPEDARTALAEAREAHGEGAVGALLALGFGGDDPCLDATDRAALRIACVEPWMLRAFLARLDPAAPGWRDLAAQLASEGVPRDVALRGIAAHAATWVALDGSLSAVGVALVAEVGRDATAVLDAVLADAGDARELAVTRLVRAMLAERPRRDEALRTLLRAVPAGLRGSAVDAMLAADADTFERDARTLADATDPPLRADRLAALEALLRHRPEAVAPHVDAQLADESPDAEALRSQLVLCFGRVDAPRFRARALAQARRDPGRWTAELASAWAPQDARPLWEALLVAGNADLATAAAPALLRIPHAERAALARRLLRDPGAVPRELIVEACAALDNDEALSLGELLAEGASEVRLAAVRALASHPAAAEALLPPHHAVERSGRVRAAIVAVLGRVPVAEVSAGESDPVRAGIAARAEATAVAVGKKRPAWLNDESLPELRWHDGAAAPASLGLHLVVTQSRRGGAEPDPEVVTVARELHHADRVAWSEAIVEAWVRADAPAKDHGALLLAALLGGEFASATLREAIPGWHRTSRRALAATATQLLAMRASDDALRALDALAAAHPHESYGAMARAALDEEAARRGVTVEAMLDGSVPTFGLDASGCAMLDLGQHRVRARWRGAAATLEDLSGVPLHGLPRPGRRDDADLVAAARRAWRLLVHVLPEVVSRETDRLVDAMASARAWSRDGFASVLDHPVLGALARRLWWDLRGESLRADEALAAMGAGDVVTLLHPAVRTDVNDLPGAPFPQLARNVALVEPAAAADITWGGLAGRTLTAKAERHARAAAPWTRHGWTPETVEEGLCHAFRLRFQSARVDAVLAVDGIALWSETDRRTRVGALRFVRWGDDRPRALGALPAALASEAITRAATMLDAER